MKKIIKITVNGNTFYSSESKKQGELTELASEAKDYTDREDFEADLDHFNFYYSEKCVEVINIHAPRYYTDTHVDVTERIGKGETFAFNIDELKLATAKSKEISTYVYDLYSYDAKGHWYQYGYAVPK